MAANKQSKWRRRKRSTSWKWVTNCWGGGGWWEDVKVSLCFSVAVCDAFSRQSGLPSSFSRRLLVGSLPSSRRSYITVCRYKYSLQSSSFIPADNTGAFFSRAPAGSGRAIRFPVFCFWQCWSSLLHGLDVVNTRNVTVTDGRLHLGKPNKKK